jgi:AcrR family transcriptional regulator
MAVPGDGPRDRTVHEPRERTIQEPGERAVHEPHERKVHGPRERMVFSAAQLIRRDGVAATGMRDVAVHAGAPRGSLQHYFPGGKEQLVNEAVAWAGRYAGKRIARFLAGLDEPTPSALFAAMVRQWTDEYGTAGFAAGCPVAAAAVDCAESTASTRDAAAAAFARWNRPVAEALTDMGVPAARAEPLATLMISALEGAVLIARTERDVRALTAVARELGPLLDAAVTDGT